MACKAVIFDLDGTLIDTLADIADAVNRVMAVRGFPPHPRGAYRRFVGDGSRMLVTRALPVTERTPQIVADCLTAFKADYARNCTRATTPYPGIPRLLTELEKRGIGMAIVTNKPHTLTLTCVRELLDGWRFDFVQGQREDLPMKPDPSGALSAADALDLSPGKILFVGDSGVDIQTARAAGMPSAGACWGFRGIDELRRNGADHLVDHPEEIMGLVGGGM